MTVGASAHTHTHTKRTIFSSSSLVLANKQATDPPASLVRTSVLRTCRDGTGVTEKKKRN